jgi:hypothetical protein
MEEYFILSVRDLEGKYEEVEVAFVIPIPTMITAKPFVSAFGLLGLDLREEKHRLQYLVFLQVLLIKVASPFIA